MWARNLVFSGISLAVCGFLALPLSSGVLREGRPLAEFDAQTIEATAALVDDSFRRSWRAAGVEPAAAADELIVARRISLGLTGAVPSLEEIRQLESWPAGERTQRWLRATLADRRSADFIAERLARAYVGADGGAFLLYRRRRFVAWLSDQIAANAPYDQIAQSLIASSGLWTDTPATNFVTATIQPDADTGPDPNQLAARVARAFLGVRIDCAECHDHPFDSWKQSDFQGLAAYFGQARQSLRGIRDAPGEYQVENRVTGELETIACRVPYRADLASTHGTPRQQLAAWVTHPENRPFAREAVNRAWAMLFGRPLIEPIDNLPRDAGAVPALDVLADDFVKHGYDLRRLLEVIASTEAFRRDSRVPAAAERGDGSEPPIDTLESAWAVFPLTRLRPEQVVGALLQSASLRTIDSSSHIVVRLARAVGQIEFVKRYGDVGAEEFADRGGAIPQRLLMMNGGIVFDKTKDDLVGNSATRIAALAPSDSAAVEMAFLTVLTRRPDEIERRHFEERLRGTTGAKRRARLGDLVWALVNTTEFSWNH